jgi:hypothetical protein
MSKKKSDKIKEKKPNKVEEEKPDKIKEGVSCAWLLGTEHGGETEKRLMFEEQLEVPVCEKHFEEHRRIMLLVANDYDIEEVVEMDPDEIARLAYTLALSGIELESAKY